MDKWTPKQEKEWADWLQGRPKVIQEAARKFKPDTCYRIKGQPNGHYALISYNENGTLQVIHGAGSFAAGFRVFGVKQEELRRCGCGKFQHATEEQTEKSRQKAQLMKDLGLVPARGRGAT